MTNAGPSSAVPLVVVMGVSGSGKTTFGVALGARLGVAFAEGDDFHPPANIAKMAGGTPLDDADRLPWLRALAQWLAAHQMTGGVVSCSALERGYRDVLREGAPALGFLHLDPSIEVVRRRIASRRGHFMPASLLDSQFQILEPLQSDERGIVLTGDRPVDQLVARCLAVAPHLTDLPTPPIRI